MARPLRIQAPGLTYHIVSRGVRRSAIYCDDIDRRRFLTMLADVAARFRLCCHAYCQMTNHYHLAITTEAPNLSRALRQLNGEYAQWWNGRHSRVGHLFQARPDAQLVQDDAYLVNVCRYIALNPVRAGIVRRPEQWRWSSYRATVGLIPSPPFLDCARLMEVIAPENPAEGRERFRQCVMDPSATRDRLPRATILGDDAFVTRFQPYRRRHPEVGRYEGRRSLDAIFQGAITRRARDEGMVVASLEQYTFADIARYLELHPSTVAKIVRRRGRVAKILAIPDLTPDADRSAE